MTNGQFRCAFFAPDYEATVTFYRDGLELSLVETWDKGENDRGTLFSAASGIIEVLALPTERDEGSVWDYREPQGVWIVIEVEDVDGKYSRALARGLPVKEELKDQNWGHRSFIVSDPNGVGIYLFSEIV